MATATAMEAALQKMRDGDFSGARELAVTAQSLFPGEGFEFDQMIAVCNVHCSGKEDWYSILGVAAEADEGSVRRQYGRMAVALHPDKNGLPGAREAFDLIVEAKAVIGDVEKRMTYDSMCRARAIAERPCFGFSKFQDNQESYGFSRFQGGGLGDGEIEIMDFGNSRVLNDQKIDLGGNGLFDCGWSNGAKLNKEKDDAILDEKSGAVGVKRGRGRPRGSGSKAASGDAATKRPQGSKEASGDAATKRPRGRPPGRGRGRGRGRSSNVQATVWEESYSQTASEAEKNKESDCRIRPDSEMLEYTDAEFHDFEQERSRECFKTGQVWAVYDTLDAMPRFYAKINAILDDKNLEITWLEPLPEDEEEIRWLYRGMPASSGKFKHGYSEVIQEYGVFSHLVKWKRDTILKKVYAIRPQKGETWAMFKKWEGLQSSSSPSPSPSPSSSEGMKFGEVEYEVVEIMSDYDGEKGVSVGVLEKVEGYGSMFGSNKEGKGEVIGAKERFRLSHKIPSVSVCLENLSFFELDPGSMPNIA